MRTLTVLAICVLLWSLVSWNRHWTNPVLDERERELRTQVRVSICRVVEIVQTLLLGYVLVSSMLIKWLPQPSAFLVLCVIGAAGCAAEAVANYRLRREDALSA